MRVQVFAAALALLVGVAAGGAPAAAQKPGGVLKVYHHDSPASMSIHEEATWSVEAPMMAVFNNLVIYKQDEPQNRLNTIVPDLATEWSWNADKTELTFKLRSGVKWHDGQPFIAADVKCTWDLLIGKGSNGKLRLNPRKAWYRNLDEITTNGEFEATFHLKRPQPAFIGLLASGYSPVYPCHIPPQEMRTHPVGTGPFKFVDYKPNEYIKLARNPDYWKPGRPYLDGIEYTIIPNRATAVLAFVSGKVDMTFPFDVTVALMKDIAKEAPTAVCDLEPAGISANLIVNRDNPPFDNPDLRRAVAYALDRKAFIDILAEGHGDIGGAMQPLPQGVWGMPPAQFYENFACGSERNYTGYCNKEIDALFDKQSMMSDQTARKQLVWEIDKKLQEDGARPILYHNQFATCWRKDLKGLKIMSNSLYNGWRFEDLWLDR